MKQTLEVGSMFEQKQACFDPNRPGCKAEARKTKLKHAKARHRISKLFGHTPIYGGAHCKLKPIYEGRSSKDLFLSTHFQISLHLHMELRVLKLYFMKTALPSNRSPIQARLVNHQNHSVT